MLSRASACWPWCRSIRSYVDANFKETQLAPIKPGQKVEVEVDALGGQSVEGTVRSARARLGLAILAAAAR